MLESLPTLLSQLEQMRSRGVPFVLVTLTGVQGNSTRKLGARMWVAQDGFSLGTVSFGSCGDGEIHKQAQQVLETGVARRFAFLVGEDEDTEMGLACTGDLEVFLEPDPAVQGIWREALERLHARQTVQLETTLEAMPRHSLSAGIEDFPVLRVQVLAAERASQPATLLEQWTPPPHLTVVGAGRIAGPLIRLARELGCEVTLYDAQPEKVALPLFPEASQRISGDLEEVLSLEQLDRWSALVVVSHNYADEVFALRGALSSEAGYLAVLASKRRGQALLNFLRELGFAPAQLERVRTPAGLDLGLDTPAGIALSILAELMAVLNGREGQPFVHKVSRETVPES